MDDAPGVSEGERVGHFTRDSENGDSIEGWSGREPACQTPAGHERQHQPGALGRLRAFEHRQDVRMVEPLEVAPFLEEVRHRASVRRQPRLEQLHRDHLCRLRIAGPKHDPHASFAHTVDQFVPVDPAQ